MQAHVGQSLTESEPSFLSIKETASASCRAMCGLYWMERASNSLMLQRNRTAGTVTQTHTAH